MAVYDWFQQGGPIMWVLLGCSIVELGIIFERAFHWFLERRAVDPDDLESFFGLVHDEDPERAIEAARPMDNRILDRLIEAYDEHDALDILVESLDREIDRIEQASRRYLFGLKTVVSVSPLLGILGTVIGIIEAFQVLGAAGAAANPQAVGAGLSEALITTAFGLSIAVPGLIAQNFFLARSREYVRTLDSYAETLEFYVTNGDDELKNKGNDDQSDCSEPSTEEARTA